MTISHFELRQYTDTRSLVKYSVIEISKDRTEEEMAVYTSNYNRAKEQGQHIANVFQAKLIDKTSHSDLFNARTMAETHALMKREG